MTETTETKAVEAVTETKNDSLQFTANPDGTVEVSFNEADVEITPDGNVRMFTTEEIQPKETQKTAEATTATATATTPVQDEQQIVLGKLNGVFNRISTCGATVEQLTDKSFVVTVTAPGRIFVKSSKGPQAPTA